LTATGTSIRPFSRMRMRMTDEAADLGNGTETGSGWGTVARPATPQLPASGVETAAVDCRWAISWPARSGIPVTKKTISSKLTNRDPSPTGPHFRRPCMAALGA